MFLGDYIDRGPYPVETFLLVVSLHNLFPMNFQLLRGNHEDKSVCEMYGFPQHVENLFGHNSLIDKFFTVFTYLPIAGIIDDKYFCVHGGISKGLTSLSELTRIQMPITEIDPLIEDLLWSDPTNSNEFYLPNPRGRGHQYGSPATDYFLRQTNLSYIIRAHTYLPNGATIFHSARVISIFSSTHYVVGGNVATMVFIDGVHVFEKFYPENVLTRRAESTFVPSKVEKRFSATTIQPHLVKPHSRSVAPKSKTVYRF